MGTAVERDVLETVAAKALTASVLVVLVPTGVIIVATASVVDETIGLASAAVVVLVELSWWAPDADVGLVELCGGGGAEDVGVVSWWTLPVML